MPPHRDVPPILAEDDPSALPARLACCRRHPELRASRHCVIHAPTKALNIHRCNGNKGRFGAKLGLYAVLRVRSRTTDIGQVGFEPERVTTALEPAFYLGF